MLLVLFYFSYCLLALGIAKKMSTGHLALCSTCHADRSGMTEILDGFLQAKEAITVELLG